MEPGGEPSQPTRLSTLADAYLKLKSETGRAPRTVDTYRHNIEKIIKPRIGHMPIGEATTMRVQAFISAVEKEHGHGSAKGCRSVLSGMLALALRSDAITVNPVVGVAGIEKPRKPRGSGSIPLEELPAFLDVVRADPELIRLDMVELWEFMALTGCRIGEALGLRWTHVDLVKHQVSPRLQREPRKGSGAHPAGGIQD